MTEPSKQPLSSVLFESEGDPSAPEQRKPRIDLGFEMIVLQCAIGCLVKDIPMSSADYVRMHLAIARLSKG